MKPSVKNYKRIVVKIGSSLFYTAGELQAKNIFEIIRSIAGLIKEEKKEVVIVSSGAIALGMKLMGLNNRPKKLPLLQAAAAVGQNELMDSYREFFSGLGMRCAQILLTWDDFTDRKRYLNAKNTLLKLLELGYVPIVNENDSVSTQEIKFGDNDKLSALVAGLIKADLLINLSDVDGFLDRDKQVIRLVEEVTPKLKSLACPSQKQSCVGGMAAKLEAAKIVMNSGIPCVITNGRLKNAVVNSVKDPAGVGTLFASKKSFKARQHWIAFGTKTKGVIYVDDGAKKALREKKSLLSVGVLRVSGNFSCGDVISIADKDNCIFAKGKSRIASGELDKVKGTRTENEVVHRDNIAVLEE